MPFAFYERLTQSRQRVYPQSNGVASVAFPYASDLRPLVDTAQRGLYHRARVSVWMRTAERRQVGRFRALPRTFLHDLCHHAGCALLGPPDSFHTEGFYQRASSLLRQLLPPAPDRMARPDA